MKHKILFTSVSIFFIAAFLNQQIGWGQSDAFCLLRPKCFLRPLAIGEMDGGRSLAMLVKTVAAKLEATETTAGELEEAINQIVSLVEGLERRTESEAQRHPDVRKQPNYQSLTELIRDGKDMAGKCYLKWKEKALEEEIAREEMKRRIPRENLLTGKMEVDPPMDDRTKSYYRTSRSNIIEGKYVRPLIVGLVIFIEWNQNEAACEQAASLLIGTKENSDLARERHVGKSAFWSSGLPSPIYSPSKYFPGRPGRRIDEYINRCLEILSGLNPQDREQLIHRFAARLKPYLNVPFHYMQCFGQDSASSVLLAYIDKPEELKLRFGPLRVRGGRGMGVPTPSGTTAAMLRNKVLEAAIGYEDKKRLYKIIDEGQTGAESILTDIEICSWRQRVRNRIRHSSDELRGTNELQEGLKNVRYMMGAI